MSNSSSLHVPVNLRSWSIHDSTIDLNLQVIYSKFYLYSSLWFTLLLLMFIGQQVRPPLFCYSSLSSHYLTLLLWLYSYKFLKNIIYLLTIAVETIIHGSAGFITKNFLFNSSCMKRAPIHSFGVYYFPPKAVIFLLKQMLFWRKLFWLYCSMLERDIFLRKWLRGFTKR